MSCVRVCVCVCVWEGWVSGWLAGLQYLSSYSFVFVRSEDSEIDEGYLMVSTNYSVPFKHHF